MTADFMTPPHSIEAEQSVLGGLLLDDDSSERTQKVLSILKPTLSIAKLSVLKSSRLCWPIPA